MCKIGIGERGRVLIGPHSDERLLRGWREDDVKCQNPREAGKRRENAPKIALLPDSKSSFDTNRVSRTNFASPTTRIALVIIFLRGIPCGEKVFKADSRFCEVAE